MKKFLAGVLNKIVDGWRWLWSEPGREAAKRRLTQAAVLADKYYPLMERITRLTPTPIDDVLVAIASEYGVKDVLHVLATTSDPGTKIRNTVAIIIKEVEGITSNSLVHLAIELACNLLKITPEDQRPVPAPAA